MEHWTTAADLAAGLLNLAAAFATLRAHTRIAKRRAPRSRRWQHRRILPEPEGRARPGTGP